MSGTYSSKNKERISNIKSLILKGSHNYLNIKSRNIKLSTLGKIFSNLENELSERGEFPKKFSLVNKTSIFNTTTDEENSKIRKLNKAIYVNSLKNKKNKTLSKGKNKSNDISFKSNKLITVNKQPNEPKKKILINLHKNQCKTQRHLSVISDIKLQKFKLIGSKDNKIIKKKYINKNIIKDNIKLKHSRNTNSNIIYDSIKNNDMLNLTQRCTINNHKNLFLSLKQKLQDKKLGISRTKNKKININKDIRKLTDSILAKKIYLKNNNKLLKEEEKANLNINIYNNNTFNDEDISFNKSDINLDLSNDNNHYNINHKKKCVSTLIKPNKKIINKTLPDRDKILDSVHINNFNCNNYILSKFKKKTSNTLYKIPLEMRKKIKNKLNTSINLHKTRKINAKTNKSNSKNNNTNANIKNNNKLLFNSITNLKANINTNTEINKSNLIFSPTTSITKDNTITIKDIITKKIMKIDSCTIAGYSSPGIQKINQDNFFIIKEFLGDEEQFFLGVCDGHGTHGHLVSEYISKIMPNYLQDTSDESIINSFNLTNKSLIYNTKIDTSLSGSTCTTLIINLEKIICANLGDSRAVLARYENGMYNAFNLSNDHKPNISSEMKRILLNGGRIEPYYDEDLQKYLGPKRVWLKNCDIPGLAMTRSIGDKVAHSVGVISEPEIIRYEFNGNEKFIILASDGIWEYIDNDECVNIVKDFYENDMDAIGALNSLVKEAFNRWKNMEDSIDDITAIVIFFE